MAVVYYVCRLGFSDNLPGPVLVTLGLSWFLINFPFAVKQLWRGARTTSSWLASDGALSLVGLVAAVLLGMFFGKAPGVPVAVGGALFLLGRCTQLTAGGWLPRTGEIVFWGVVLGLCLACWIWGDGYHDPLVRWALLNGQINQDGLHHAAMTNMIRTYGVPSTGLDGVPYRPYHWGSHFVLTQLGQLLDIPGIDVYQLTYPVVILPLLVHSVIIAGLALARPGDAAQLPRSVLIWLTLLVGFVGVLPFSASKSTGVFYISDLVSESMCLAIVVLLLGLAAGAPSFLTLGGGTQERVTIDGWLALILYPVFVGILGLLKVSVMAVFLGASILVYLTMGSLRRRRLVGFTLVFAFVALLLVRGVVGSPGAEKALFLLFAYVRRYVGFDWRAYHPFIELQILIPALVLRLWQERCDNLATLIGRWRSGAMLDIGFAVFAAAIGCLPGLILDIGGGSASYFSTVQRWIALPILLGALLSVVRWPSEPLPGKEHLSHTPLWRVGAWFLLLPIALTLVLNTVSRARELARANLTDRGLPRFAPSDVATTNPRSSIKQALRQGNSGRAAALIQEYTAAQQARRDANARTIDILVDLYRLPKEEKRNTLLHIPKTNLAFWSLLDQREPSFIAPFLAPALSGLALLDGLPNPEDIPIDGGYGYVVYSSSRETSRSSNADQARADLCRKAEGMGFKRILVLDLNRDGMPFLREWCFAGAQPILDNP
jgi:hypothetical protein